MKPDGPRERRRPELEPITTRMCVFLACANDAITSFGGVNQSPSCDKHRASLHLIIKIGPLAASGVPNPFSDGFY